ncbi:MAG: hypothetical protein OXN17_14575 [Candidatus Poribacteria bacterium]|nr:hypothetical protein [Candidatus Poribacteria bacterium]
MPLRENSELIEFVAPLLDEAITTVGEQEYIRLRRAADDDAQVAENATEAVKSLALMQYGRQPAFNEWDALFYITDYQPGHINFALQVLEGLIQEAPDGLAGKPSLHIINVGCGALAVQFAVAILAAVYNVDGATIVVKGIDTRPAMKVIGTTLWKQFRTLVDRYPKLSALSHACDGLTTRAEVYDSYASFWRAATSPPPADAPPECWLVSLDPVFEANKDEIAGALQTLHERYSDNVRLAACFDLTLEIDRCVPRGGLQFKRPRKEMLPFQGKLPITSKWREELVAELSKLPQNAYSRNVAGLLQIPVIWPGRLICRGSITTRRDATLHDRANTTIPASSSPGTP